MNAGFAVRLALREARHGLRRVGVYMASITLGVAALVALHSFRDDVARSIQEEAEELMGANARLSGSAAYPDSVEAVLDSLRGEGVDVARVTTAMSMVLGRPSDEVRLLQVRGVSGAYPFYGEPLTRPAGLWTGGIPDGVALVDPAVLAQLRVRPGDTLVVGGQRVVVAGSVENVPTDLGFQTAIGPRVWVSTRTLEAAELLGFGSLARYEAFLRLPDLAEREALRERYGDLLARGRVRYTLAEEQARSLGNSVRFLGRYLGLVGLGALLLGGIGVASAIHVYLLERRPGIAVLRCIGARQGTVFLAYLLQAAVMGLGGAALGVVLGIAVQALLPLTLGGALPVDVAPRLSPGAALAGLGVGVWVATIFALIPLLEIRDVPPLHALRQDVDGPPRARGRLDPARLAAWLALAASVVALAVAEAPDPRTGFGFAGGLAVAVGLLAGTGWVLVRLTRRFFPGRAQYTVRQGVSNLFRPRNQTVSITLALGFGAFVVGTVVEIEGNLLDDLSMTLAEGGPNVLLFDIQPDQLEGVTALLPPEAQGSVRSDALVPARLARINGMTGQQRLDLEDPELRPERWALRREYRNTSRAELGPAETLVAGEWWDPSEAATDGDGGSAPALPGVSLEEEIASDLRVGLGDTLTWAVSGIAVTTVVRSLRRVEWNRLEPNFFAVLEPGALEGAPHTIVTVARIPDASRRAAFQRELVAAYPNVSVLDFSRVQEAVDSLLARVRQAVTFLGAFSALAGVVVLAGALATSRARRMREGALLKTLGARRGQIVGVLLSEYLAIGTLATATGLLLALAGSAVLVPAVFEVPFRPHPVPLALIWLAVAGVTTAVGLLGSRGLLRRPPLSVLRDAVE